MKVNLKDTALCPGTKNVDSESIICVSGGLSNFQTSFNSVIFTSLKILFVNILYNKGKSS